MTTDQLQDGTRITILTVDTNDPAHLYGILDHLRDLNITLISVYSSNHDPV
jgi:prephenate dehydratase